MRIYTRIPIEDRFWSKVIKTKACWIWSGSKNNLGYGNISTGRGKSPESAHRLSYKIHKGKIKNGYDIDHLCRNPSCVNPEHLEAVTHKENILRGESPCAKYAKRTHCKKSHEYTKENTLRSSNGSRLCRICNRELYRRMYARRSSFKRTKSGH